MSSSCRSDELYMRRALQLAKNGLGNVSPNPMVGAVIVASNGKIIGEGWHRKFGGPHAEVNACNSVADSDKDLIKESTIYVTLEPCSHHGKTPPCTDLLLREQFKRVVIGSSDPFHRVNGNGINRLREAGVDVTVGVLEKECRELNRKFFTAHTIKRPYVTLKWAQSIDFWMDSWVDHPHKFSTSTGQTLVHRLRAENDCIITSTKTILADDPQMNNRLWKGLKSPEIVVLGSSELNCEELRIFRKSNPIVISQNKSLEEILTDLYEQYGFISALVEAGPTLLNSFIKSGLWDEARVEVSPIRLHETGKSRAPEGLPAPSNVMKIDSNQIYFYQNV